MFLIVIFDRFTNNKELASDSIPLHFISQIRVVANHASLSRLTILIEIHQYFYYRLGNPSETF